MWAVPVSRRASTPSRRQPCCAASPLRRTAASHASPRCNSSERRLTNSVQASSTMFFSRGSPATSPLRGLAAMYARTCERCECAPSHDVMMDLMMGSTLVVDLRLCRAETVTGLCAFLREAPCGLRQIMLCDGRTSLGDDAGYQERARAMQRRSQSGALQLEHMRFLMAALSAFLAVRGAQLSVLDLAGAPLGQEPPSLLAPLVRAMGACRARELRRLGLSSCHLGDRGLTMLLPLLAGPANTLPHLQALLLAWNNLGEIRLVTALLQTRTELCMKRRAAPLHLLDLSGNMRLGTAAVSAPHIAPLTQRGNGGKQQRNGDQHRPKACKRSGATLVQTVVSFIAAGLPLRVLRLRRLNIGDDDLRPLLELMQKETARCLNSYDLDGNIIDFCLEEIDLSGNPTDPALMASLMGALEMLQKMRIKPEKLQEASNSYPRRSSPFSSFIDTNPVHSVRGGEPTASKSSRCALVCPEQSFNCGDMPELTATNTADAALGGSPGESKFKVPAKSAVRGCRYSSSDSGSDLRISFEPRKSTGPELTNECEMTGNSKLMKHIDPEFYSASKQPELSFQELGLHDDVDGIGAQRSECVQVSEAPSSTLQQQPQRVGGEPSGVHNRSWSRTANHNRESSPHQCGAIGVIVSSPSSSLLSSSCSSLSSSALASLNDMKEPESWLPRAERLAELREAVLDVLTEQKQMSVATPPHK